MNAKFGVAFCFFVAAVSSTSANHTYLIVSPPKTYCHQISYLIRSLWLAHHLSSILVLPPFFVSYYEQAPDYSSTSLLDDSNLVVVEADLGKLFKVDYFIVQVYCQLGVLVSHDIPFDKQPILSVSPDTDAQLLKEPLHDSSSLLASSAANEVWTRVPSWIFKTVNPAQIFYRSQFFLHSPNASAENEESEGEVEANAHKAKIAVVLPKTKTETSLMHLSMAETAGRSQFKKNILGSLQPSRDVAAVVKDIILKLQQTYAEKLGRGSNSGSNKELKFAAVLFSARAVQSLVGVNASAAQEAMLKVHVTKLVSLLIKGLLAAVDPSEALVYVMTQPFVVPDSVIKGIQKSFHVVTKEMVIPEISIKYPENEILMAFEHWVAKESAVFFGDSKEQLSSLIFETRCFTPTSSGKMSRSSVFYDMGITLATCRILN